MATLLLNSEGTVIKALLNKTAVFNYQPLILFFLIWYSFTVVTYGTMVPAGLFLPGILIGCSMGRMVGSFIENSIIREIKPSTYAIIGSASILAGYTRLSFSLAVIMLETTENVGLFLPIIFALFVSFSIGRIFNRSIYIGAIRLKSIPFLVEDIPEQNRNITAGQLMTSHVITLKASTPVASVLKALQSHDFNGYPIVDSKRQLRGLISRQNLTVLLRKRCWSVAIRELMPAKYFEELHTLDNNFETLSARGEGMAGKEASTPDSEEGDDRRRFNFMLAHDEPLRRVSNNQRDEESGASTALGEPV